MLWKTRKKRLRELSESVPFWFHSIELGRGVVTPGRKPLADMNALLEALSLPSLQGKSVLDIGAWDGFFSFAAERRGAARVKALDHYVWNLDLAAQEAYHQQCYARGELPRPYEDLPELWKPKELPGKRGFDAAHEALGSRVEDHVTDFMATDSTEIGRFDVTLFLGVLYHLTNPLEALRRLAQVTGEQAVIETAAVELAEERALWEFFPEDELNHDVSNWWAPNARGLQEMCRAAGFAETIVVFRSPPVASLSGGSASGEAKRYRLVVHAWK